MSRLQISHELVGEAYVGTFTWKASLAMSFMHPIGQSITHLLFSVVHVPGMALGETQSVPSTEEIESYWEGEAA